MIRCEICKKITKPNESTNLLYTYRPSGAIDGQKRVCSECYIKNIEGPET